jgi:phosphoenolpyruvate synthase/pyruvate phosphate dikinase
MAMTVRLTDPDAECIELCGGKAAGLARLVRQGFSVPPALVVTTQAYLTVLSSDSRRDALLTAPLPAGLADELAGFIKEGTAYAVRSSATLEDLGEASFAGQHDTVLGCVGLPSE